MIKAVLFDLDGTLVNSLSDLANSTNYALKKFGFPTHETEKFKYFVGDGMPKLIERVLPMEHRDADTHAKVLECFMNHYREHYVDETIVYDGIKELIRDLKEKGFKLAVISNKAQEMALTVTNKLLDDVFDIVCGKQEGYPAKPDPALTLKVIRELGVLPSECAFIGDSGMDMAVAKNAKCLPIGVLWGFREMKELSDYGADYVVNSPFEILQIIGEVNEIQIYNN